MTRTFAKRRSPEACTKSLIAAKPSQNYAQLLMRWHHTICLTPGIWWRSQHKRIYKLRLPRAWRADQPAHRCQQSLGKRRSQCVPPKRPPGYAARLARYPMEKHGRNTWSTQLALVGCLVLGHKFKVHQIVWLLEYGYLPSQGIDHKDRDKRNNSTENLRPASDLDNIQNISTAMTPAAGTKVARGRTSFQAIVQYRGKKHYFGSFKTVEEAHLAYLKGKHQLCGSFAPS